MQCVGLSPGFRPPGKAHSFLSSRLNPGIGAEGEDPFYFTRMSGREHLCPPEGAQRLEETSGKVSGVERGGSGG